MNSGTLKGGARAVKLDTLLKLEDMRVSRAGSSGPSNSGGGSNQAGGTQVAAKIGSLLDYVAYIIAR